MALPHQLLDDGGGGGGWAAFAGVLYAGLGIGLVLPPTRRVNVLAGVLRPHPEATTFLLPFWLTTLYVQPATFDAHQYKTCHVPPMGCIVPIDSPRPAQ
jgi:hypothetical protein